MGLKSFTAARKPLVTALNRKKRLQFAKEHIDWTLEQRQQIIWVDESQLTLYQHDRRMRVRREAQEALQYPLYKPLEEVYVNGGKSYKRSQKACVKVQEEANYCPASRAEILQGDSLNYQH
ncbi:hypothetical protein AVEN_4348-1 [Araneus ventricosus]|uniref:Transposase Tc1-like domain-containing protein n=1 Tax=Araneus ventricosus TaxID=182803 RepID=A0A4Y2MTX4_ARAVE|nr:hypothetical protein AVEN_246726-1 [Araneus ventricosus]GBN30694.1 hypothetical protein AVEN_222254-1 [Araneus ventricosus]GBN32302.1 hypothetical protein AVEN_262293-1 [Araneus ventricosus]GBN33003.1 hypothetical protein AVEN_4348-1 [Araneus ventricosus]